jgi:hypothetical protein
MNFKFILECRNSPKQNDGYASGHSMLAHNILWENDIFAATQKMSRENLL